MEEKKNGRKIAYIIIASIIAASIFAVAIITAFYETYDPSKYGRNNGGVDEDNKGVPETEFVDHNNWDEFVDGKVVAPYNYLKFKII